MLIKDLDDGGIELISKIDRNPKDTKRFVVSEKGGEAVTRVFPLANYHFALANGSKEAMSMVRAVPLSGRTHQIRVHLKALGFPIVGDWLYGGRKHYRWVKEKLDRQFLHAKTLSLTKPDGQKLTFQSSLPNDLETFLSFLRKVRKEDFL